MLIRHVTDLSSVLSFITGDNTDGGMKAADSMATACITRWPIISSRRWPYLCHKHHKCRATRRVQQEITTKYPGIHIVDVGYSQSQASVANTNVSNWLTKYPISMGSLPLMGRMRLAPLRHCKPKVWLGKSRSLAMMLTLPMSLCLSKECSQR